MTAVGMEAAIERIRNRYVVLPDEYRTMTAAELKAWLEGYMQCQKDDAKILEDLVAPQK